MYSRNCPDRLSRSSRIKSAFQNCIIDYEKREKDKKKDKKKKRNTREVFLQIQKYNHMQVK